MESMSKEVMEQRVAQVLAHATTDEARDWGSMMARTTDLPVADIIERSARASGKVLASQSQMSDTVESVVARIMNAGVPQSTQAAMSAYRGRDDPDAPIVDRILNAGKKMPGPPAPGHPPTRPTVPQRPKPGEPGGPKRT
jgi:hypothetical protein